jgi:hypothetical protein
MTSLRFPFSTTIRVITLRSLILLAALGTGAVHGETNSVGASGARRRPSPRENMRQAFTTAIPLPAGAELSYQPVQAGEVSLSNVEIDPAQAEQRAQELSADLKTIVPVERLPAIGSAEFLKLRTDALAIVKRHFQESRAALEPDAIREFAMHVTWTPDFSATPRTISVADRERARATSYSVAYAITHLDRPRFVVAYAAAVLALNPDGPLEAGNAASAIVTSGERRFGAAGDAANLAASRHDAAVVYRYALACSVVDTKWTLRSLGILINPGNLYVDMKSPERARPVLLAARAFAPDSWDAALALASCYVMQGRPELAKAALEDKAVKRSVLYATAAKGSAQLDAIHATGDLSPDSPDEDFEAALKTFEGRETMTAADFVDQIDPAERNRMRRFVDDLPVQGSYRAPQINDLTQFSTLQSISTPAGFRALGDFSERLGAQTLKMMGYMVHSGNEMLSRLGLNIKYDVDLNDVMANPERYKNRKINVSVSGVEELKARMGAMKAQAEQMKRDLQNGNMAAILQPSPIALATNPGLAIYTLKPFEYANPMDVMMQQYNASVLGRKLHTYNSSFFATNGRTRAALTEIRERHAQQYAEIREMEDLEMAAFQRRKAEAAKSGANINSPHWRILEHNIHKRFLTDYNARAEFAWKEATQVAAKAYSDKIKPRAERFYYDVFRHIALISDPEVREKKNREFEQMLLSGVNQGLWHVVSAFGAAGYTQEWDCRCDVGSLLAEAAQEEKALDQIRQERDARQQQERLRFASGEIPPASPLFKKLDAYGTDLDIPGIPLLSGRISCARSTFTLAGQLPTKIGVKGNYTFTESAFTGATTHAGGIEVGATLKEGSLSTSATLNVRGSVSLDGKGTVTDYSVTGSSTVKMGMGPVTGTIGAEIGYTPAGGLTSDVSGGLTAVLKGEYGRSVEVTLEGSARRGSTFSAKAEQALNPYSGEINGFLKEVSQESVGERFPFSTELKKELWSGKFAL